MIKSNFSTNFFRSDLTDRSLFQIHFLLFFQQLEYTLCRGRCRLELVRHISHLRDRLVEASYVLYERLDITDGYFAVDRQISQVSDQHCDRHHDAGQELRLPSGFT